VLTVLSSIVGEGESLQHKPFSISFVLPTDITTPVQEADVGVTTDTSVVSTSGKTDFSFLQLIPSTIKSIDILATQAVTLLFASFIVFKYQFLS
jgi:hypothetical protein